MPGAKEKTISATKDDEAPETSTSVSAKVPSALSRFNFMRRLSPPETGVVYDTATSKVRVGESSSCTSGSDAIATSKDSAIPLHAEEMMLVSVTLCTSATS